MELLVKVGRWFFALCLVGLAGQQLYYSAFRPVFVPPWPSPVTGELFLVYLFSVALIGAAVSIALEKKARTVSLLLGGLFFALLLFSHIPYELRFDPYSKQIGSWGNAFKELALSGGAFAIAGSYPGGPEVPVNEGRQASGQRKTTVLRLLELFIPAGSVFFSITMITFGIEHFIYVDFVVAFVPAWIPGHLFWTYFCAVALIGAGLAIILRIRLRLIATLLGVMIFLWFIMVHIPRAAVAPVTDQGNELTSVFEALGFSGVAFVIANGYKRRQVSSEKLLHLRGNPA